MTPGRWCAAVTVAAVAVAVLLPLSPALSSVDVRAARLIAAGLTAAVCTAVWLFRSGRPIVRTAVSITAATAGLVLLLMHVAANATCVATYDGRTILIGREYTPSAADYVNKNPGLSATDLLLEAGGAAGRIWTSASISSCKFWTGLGGLLAIPLFAGAVSALVDRGFRFAPTAASRSGDPSSRQEQSPVYDVFLSYRHTEPDKTNASEILASLESRGLRVAVDFRDFAPNQHFLSEMERCIKESRFVLCIVTTRYLDSDNCSEEAIISKTLDMGDRKKRLVPLIFERVDLPVWLHGIVGIDFTESAQVDPIERLFGLLTSPTKAPSK
jgi:TIR domain